MEIINLGNIVLNNYLLRILSKNILIDTGYPKGFELFKRKLLRHNISLSDIDYIVLTHAHDDHAGFLNELIEISKAKLVLHKKSIERLMIGHNEWIGGCSGNIAKYFFLLMGLLGKSKHEYPKVQVKENYVVFDGYNQPLEEDGLPLKIVELPGHTADSIGILFNNEMIFCGDAAMNGFPSINRNIIWIEDRESYIRSWDKMISLDVKKIFPSHGKPFESFDLVRYKRKLDKIKLRKIKIPDYS